MPDIYIASDKKSKHLSKEENRSPQPLAPIRASARTKSLQSKVLSSKPQVPNTDLQTELAREIGKIDPNGQPQPTSRSLTGFAFFPPHTNFETQAKEEQIILLLRRHPITNLPWIVLSALFLILPTFLRYVSLPSLIPPHFVTVSVMIWYLLTLAFIFEKFLSWYFNVDIVTDERIIDVDFSNLIYKDISDAKIDDIQEVQVVVGGVLRTVVNFGTVYIQTASARPNFEFVDVPNPEQVSKVIDKLRLIEEQEQLEGRAR